MNYEKLEFLASDIEKICGVKRNRLQVWLEKGWIVPSIQRASGHGTRNIWHIFDLFDILLFKRGVENGLQRESLGQIIGKIKWKDYLEDIFNFEKITAEWLCFVRQEGKIISAVSPQVMVLEGDDFPEHLNADDLIGINITKIIVDVTKEVKKAIDELQK